MNVILKNLTLVALVLISSCKDEDESHINNNNNVKAPLVIDLSAVVSTMPLELQTRLYKDHLDRDYKVELLKFYLSNWHLEKTDGSFVSLNKTNLVDFSSDELFSLEAEIDTGTYQHLHFGIGLDSILNTSDPADFESSHPLSIAQNTHWNWVSKYKFFMLEGRVDPLGGANPSLPFSYHTGFDQSYREVSLPLHNLHINKSGDSLHLELDVANIVNGANGTVDFISENFSHSIDEMGISETISDNLVGSFSLQ